QGFTIATYRAETRHHIQLGAERSGRLTSLTHEGSEVTSRPSGYAVAGINTTARMYACPNIATRVTLVHADRNTPGFMLAPPDPLLPRQHRPGGRAAVADAAGQGHPPDGRPRDRHRRLHAAGHHRRRPAGPARRGRHGADGRQ